MLTHVDHVMICVPDLQHGIDAYRRWNATSTRAVSTERRRRKAIIGPGRGRWAPAAVGWLAPRERRVAADGESTSPT